MAENEERSPWTPWNVDKGFDKDTSTVSIALVYPGPDIYNHTARTPEELLDTLVSSQETMWAWPVWEGGCSAAGRTLRPRETCRSRISSCWRLPTAISSSGPVGAGRMSRTTCTTRAASHSKNLYANAVRPQAEALRKTRPELMWLVDQPDTLVAIAEGPHCFEIFVTGGEVGRSQFHWGASEIPTVAIEE